MLNIGTRGSHLATTQAGHVRDALLEWSDPIVSARPSVAKNSGVASGTVNLFLLCRGHRQVARPPLCSPHAPSGKPAPLSSGSGESLVKIERQ